MSEQEGPQELQAEPSGGIGVQMEIPAADMPDGLLLPVYANHVNVMTTGNEVVITFHHVTPLQTQVGGEARAYNRVVQRIVLPRSVAKRVGEILQAALKE